MKDKIIFLDFDEINYKVIPYVWKPKDGEEYWYVDCNMNVLNRFYKNRHKFYLKCHLIFVCKYRKQLLVSDILKIKVDAIHPINWRLMGFLASNI